MSGAASRQDPLVSDVAKASVGVGGLALCITLVFLGMRAVMDVGGACADGGPYVSAQSCPDGSTPALLLGIFGLFLFGGIAMVYGVAAGRDLGRGAAVRLVRPVPRARLELPRLRAVQPARRRDRDLGLAHLRRDLRRDGPRAAARRPGGVRRRAGQPRRRRRSADPAARAVAGRRWCSSPRPTPIPRRSRRSTGRSPRPGSRRWSSRAARVRRDHGPLDRAPGDRERHGRRHHRGGRGHAGRPAGPGRRRRGRRRRDGAPDAGSPRGRRRCSTGSSGWPTCATAGCSARRSTRRPRSP